MPPKLICPICGRIVEHQKHSPGPLPTYCSHACRQKAYRRRHTLDDGLRRLGIEPVSLEDWLAEREIAG